MVTSEWMWGGGDGSDVKSDPRKQLLANELAFDYELATDPPVGPVGSCPAEPSGYVLTAMAHARDLNGDGFVCVKKVRGKGNQRNSTNIIDNDQ